MTRDGTKKRPRQRKPTDGQRWLATQVSVPPPSLRLWDVVRSALRAGRRRLGMVVATTVVVYVILGGFETLVSALTSPSDSWSSTTIDLVTTLFNFIGATFIAGFFGRSVGAAEHGLPEQTTWEVLRTQPYGRLIRADLLVSLFTVVAAALLALPGLVALSALEVSQSRLILVVYLILVIPGIVVLNLLNLVGSAIKLEGRAVGAALRRSAHLVRSHFWTVLALTTAPLLIGSDAASWLQGRVDANAVAYFVVRVVTNGIVAALCGLTQSELGYRLMATAHIREASGKNG